MSVISRLVDKVLFWGGFASGIYVAYRNMPAVLKRSVALLSNNPNAKQLLSDSGLTSRLAQRFAAIDTVDKAVSQTQTLNSQGIGATLHLLRGSARFPHEALEAKNAYLDLIGRITAQSLNATLSIPPAQIGLTQSPQFVQTNLTTILEAAQAGDVFVMLETETSDTIQPTINLYLAMREAGYDQIGISLPINLRRTSYDLETLTYHGAHVRLIVGGYGEQTIAEHELVAKFDAFVQRMLSTHAVLRGAKLTLHSSNNHILQQAFDGLRSANLPKETINIELPYGERAELPPHLAKENYPVRVYLPIGTNTDAYIMRRIYTDPTLLLS